MSVLTKSSQQKFTPVPIGTRCVVCEDRSVTASCMALYSCEECFANLENYNGEVGAIHKVSNRALNLGLRLQDTAMCRNSVKMMRDCALRGCSQSMLKLGFLLANGVVVDMNKAMAIQIWKKSMQHDNTHATFILGHCYFYGINSVEVDVEEAIDIWSKGAIKGHELCRKIVLGIMAPCSKESLYKLYVI